MTDALPPSEYDAEDSIVDGGECCAECKAEYTGHNVTNEVYTQSGTHYDHFIDSDPGAAPFFCPDCWTAAVKARRMRENTSLGDYQ